MQAGGHDIGVCSWSLRPADVADLVAKVKELGLGHVQLGLARLLDLGEEERRAELAKLKESGLVVTAGMVSFPGEDYSSIAVIKQTGGYAPDEPYLDRRERTLRAGRMCLEMGVAKLTTHIGFVPASSHPSYETMVKRVGEIAAALGDMGVMMGFETGQEPAAELLQFMNDVTRSNVFVNFDPANMILYGAGDPIEAVRTLGRHVAHVHCKDATLSKAPGTVWGDEVPFGTGQVDVVKFAAALNQIGYAGPLVIEREAGEQRMADVRTAVGTIVRVFGEQRG